MGAEPVTLSAGPRIEPVSLCWICKGPLEFWTDGDGHLDEGCTACRQKIEALQRHPGLFFFRPMAVTAALPVPEPSGPDVVYVPCQLAPSRLKRAREIASREGMVVAARRTGVKYETVYWHAKRERWRVRDGRTGRSRVVGQGRTAHG